MLFFTNTVISDALPTCQDGAENRVKAYVTSQNKRGQKSDLVGHGPITQLAWLTEQSS